jgi:hypothetical protein
VSSGFALRQRQPGELLEPARHFIPVFFQERRPSPAIKLRMMWAYLGLLVVIGGAAAQIPFIGGCPKVDTVQDLDIKKVKLSRRVSLPADANGPRLNHQATFFSFSFFFIIIILAHSHITSPPLEFHSYSFFFIFSFFHFFIFSFFFISLSLSLPPFYVLIT